MHKITLVLTIGMETGVVAAALQEQMKMLKTAGEQWPLSRAIFLEVTERLLKEVENQVNAAVP